MEVARNSKITSCLSPGTVPYLLTAINGIQDKNYTISHCGFCVHLRLVEISNNLVLLPCNHCDVVPNSYTFVCIMYFILFRIH